MLIGLRWEPDNARLLLDRKRQSEMRFECKSDNEQSG